jgi:hypothetical protein
LSYSLSAEKAEGENANMQNFIDNLLIILNLIESGRKRAVPLHPISLKEA